MSVVAVKKHKDHIEVAADAIVLFGYGTQRKDRAAKLFENKKTGIICGGVGELSTVGIMKHFLDSHMPKTNDEYGWMCLFVDFVEYLRSISPNANVEGSAFIVIHKGKIFILDSYVVKEEKKFAAIGAGMDYALTALYLGHTAEKAADVAAELSSMCERPIKVFKIKI